VVQGGGFDGDFNEVASRNPVMNESGNGLKNNAMTIAMARYDDPHSATNSFYINMADNEVLNPGSRSWGYTVFGDVISGQDVLEAMAAAPTGYNEAVDFQDVPLMPITLVKVTIN
jgi:peptidyl-prolyl cis-trans isomerase A (cyclophilin A)